MSLPAYTTIPLVNGIFLVDFVTSKRWAVVSSERLRIGFNTAMLNLKAMDTTQECLMRTNWKSSIAKILQVDSVISMAEWSKMRDQKATNSEDDE